MNKLGFISLYIYTRVFLVISFLTELYPGRVSDFLIKFELDPDPLRVFFFENPYPTLFFIGLGKIRPNRVGPDQVSTDRI